MQKGIFRQNSCCANILPELQPLKMRAVSGNGSYQVLELDLQGNPLSCSHGQHLQVLHMKGLGSQLKRQGAHLGLGQHSDEEHICDVAHASEH